MFAFRGNDNIHLQNLRDILITFAAFHPEVSYAQGMNDLLSRFLVVLDNEVCEQNFSCFSDKINNNPSYIHRCPPIIGLEFSDRNMSELPKSVSEIIFWTLMTKHLKQWNP